MKGSIQSQKQMTDKALALHQDFASQQQKIRDEIIALESELFKKKELYVKLQGAIETLDILNQQPEPVPGD